MSGTSYCRSCGQLIVWARTGRGKKMPLDIIPSKAGEFYLYHSADQNEFEAVHVGSKDKRAETARRMARHRHTSHFATCPQADKWRKKDAKDK